MRVYDFVVGGVWTPTLIKTIQAGTVSIIGTDTSGTATLASPVDLKQSLLLFLGCQTTESTAQIWPSDELGRVEFGSSTTVIGRREGSTLATMVISFVVVEFRPRVLRTNQTGTIAIVAGTTVTTFAIPVNTRRACVLYQGHTNNRNLTDSNDSRGVQLELDSNTAVRGTRPATAAGTSTVAWQVVEFV